MIPFLLCGLRPVADPLWVWFLVESYKLSSSSALRDSYSACASVWLSSRQ